MDDYAGELHVAARRYLELVRSCTQETGQLVDDLLDFAKLGRQPLRKSLTDPSELVQESLDELKAEREGRDVELRLDTLPTCYADPRLLKLVFINLLQNAFKFTRKRETAVIEVGWHQGRSGPIYHVRDNGIGFSMEYADQAFGVFQRLHRSEDYEGTGVGLAIVQRIIQRHGGKIWVETVTDKGATFFFTLEEEAKHA
jgi:light-regulated signal transduction histidine kinase (bacteriophytochrome)